MFSLSASHLILLNSPLSSSEGALWSQLWKNGQIRVVADGAANRLYATDYRDRVEYIVGDGDSIQEDVKEYYEQVASAEHVDTSCQIRSI